jgi:hypothetical protein
MSQAEYARYTLELSFADKFKKMLEDQIFVALHLIHSQTPILVCIRPAK